MSEQLKITCSGCSLLCDDIIIIKENNEIKEILGACQKGINKFHQIKSKNRILSPLYKDKGGLKVLEWDLALNKAIQMIKDAKKPLIYGLSTISCESQILALKIAKKIDAFIDSNSTICQGKFLNIASKMGITTTTLTEIINKSDLIILWGTNIVESIPRLFSKILFSRGKFRMTGREIKNLIIVDIYKTASFKVMGTRDLAIILRPNEDIELIKILKKAVKGKYTFPNEGISGIDKQDLERFKTFLLNSEHITILPGQALLNQETNGDAIKELLELVNILNNVKNNGRISLLMVGGHYNMVGFEHIALSETGRNQSIQFKNGESIKSDDNIISKIQKEDFDLSIIIGTDPISHLPLEISKILSSKPIILIDNKKSGTFLIATLILPTSITGIENKGLAFRLDHVPIQLKKIIEPPNLIQSDYDLLKKILDRLNE